MTKREAAIVSAYTGYLVGDPADLNVYLAELMARASKEALADAGEAFRLEGDIHEKAKDDFIALVITP